MNEFYKQIAEIRFTTVDDLYNRIYEIRKFYKTLPYDTKEVYKWYFYFQLCLVRNPLKELLWDYINFDYISQELRLNLALAYVDFCSQRTKKMHNYKEDEELD